MEYNYKQIGFNALAAFTGAFFLALGAGQSVKVAAGLGIAAVLTNFTGLFQSHPKA